MLLDHNNVDEAVGILGTCRIKVVGVGGGGVNAIRRMSSTRVPGVEYVFVNTDVVSRQGVAGVPAIPLGERLTRGLGAGGNPMVGRHAAQETQERLRAHLKGADLVFIAAGMGGGTGTGAAPVVAEYAKEAGAITVAVVTTPFGFEGNKRMTTASNGLKPLQEMIDTLIVVSNDRLMSSVSRGTSVRQAFSMADQVMVRAILGVSRIINTPGEVNVDFADIRVIVKGGGQGIMGIGQGEGEDRVLKAAKAALEHPLVDIKAQGARAVLFVVTGGPDVTIGEMTEAGTYISSVADPDAQIFFGMHTEQGRKANGPVEMVLIATHLPPQGDRWRPESEEIRKLKATVPIYEAEQEVPPFLRKSWLPDDGRKAGVDWTRYGTS